MTDDDDPPRPTRPPWVLPAALICTVPLLVLGVAVGGWPGVVLVLMFGAVVVAIALEP